MASIEPEFLNSLKSLSTAKDKIFEISSLMVGYQSSFSKQLVSLWLQEFNSLKEEKKKLAMLFVMNDTLMKSAQSNNEEYLKEFPMVMNEIIQNLIDSRSDYLLDELRKIVMVWEKPGALLYAPQYTAQLKASIQDAINAVFDERSGASVIQEFEITKRLCEVENRHFSNLELASEINSVIQGSEEWKKKSRAKMIEHCILKCEEELIERSMLLMELAGLLENQYSLYNSLRS